MICYPNVKMIQYGDELGLKFKPWSDTVLADLQHIVKSLGFRWRAHEKAWTSSPVNVSEALDIWGHNVMPTTPNVAKAYLDAHIRLLLSDATEPLDDETLQTQLKQLLTDGHELYPFQRAGVQYIEATHGKALVGDEMGLGKTIQTLAYLAIHPELRPILVVCPSVLTINWINEIHAWLRHPGKTVRLKSGKDKVPEDASFVVISYGLLSRSAMHEKLKTVKFKGMVVDECHYVKNYRAKRTQSVRDMAASLGANGSIIALSGTPILNRPAEFFTMLNMMRGDTFSSWWYFTKRYCNGHDGAWGWEFSGASHMKELQVKLRDIMIRRIKSAVLPSLPAKMRQKIHIELPPAAMKRCTSVSTDSAIQDIVALRKLVGLEKVPYAVALVMDIISNSRPVVIYAHHHDVIDAMVNSLSADIKVQAFTGRDSTDRRQELVEQFQHGDIQALIISTKAGGVGITLTQASDVVVLERQWTPADEEQAEDRLHRIGQQNSVMVRYLVANDTIDEIMDELLETKRDIIMSVMVGEHVNETSTDIRGELIQRISQDGGINGQHQ